MKVEISNGELVDKLTILEIKLSKADPTTEAGKRYHIEKEHDILKPLVSELSIDPKIIESLSLVNSTLWETEDEIRQKEKKQEFDDEFTNLARKVYINNDERYRIKKEINSLTSSDIQEQKLYNNM